MVEAFIFDMDGVIVDSEDYWEDSAEDLIKELGAPEDFDFSDLTGMAIDDIYEEIVPQLDEEITSEEFSQAFDKQAEQLYREKVELRPSLRKALETLRLSDVDVGLCSSSPKSWIKIVLNRFELEKFFDAVISSEDIPVKSKPDPDIYEYAAERLDTAPEQCIVVEDSENGVEAAERAGMNCIAIDGTRKQGLGKADFQVENGEELLQKIKQLTKK
ncbi:MAG: HAD family hydrolase [Candidatus Nanohalobium sp.]